MLLAGGTSRRNRIPSNRSGLKGVREERGEAEGRMRQEGEERRGRERKEEAGRRRDGALRRCCWQEVPADEKEFQLSVLGEGGSGRSNTNVDISRT